MARPTQRLRVHTARYIRHLLLFGSGWLGDLDMVSTFGLQKSRSHKKTHRRALPLTGGLAPVKAPNGRTFVRPSALPTPECVMGSSQ